MQASGCCFANTFILNEVRRQALKGRDSPGEAIDALWKSYNEFSIDVLGLALSREFLSTNFTKWRNLSTKWSRQKLSEKKLYLSMFSEERWKMIPLNNRSPHSFKLCQPCSSEDIHIRQLFPNGRNVLKIPKKSITVTLPRNPRYKPQKALAHIICNDITISEVKN